MMVELLHAWSELSGLIQSDECVLFLGADISYDFAAHKSPPSRLELAEILRNKSKYTGYKTSLYDVSQFYENKYGRQDLISTVKRVVQGTPYYEPTSLHELIVSLPFSAIITTRYDDLLERAYSKSGKRLQVIIDNTQVPYIESNQVVLLKLGGCITKPDSLVVTRLDFLSLQRKLGAVLSIVRYLFATKHLLFVDYDIESEEFLILFHEVTSTVGAHHRRVYVSQPQLNTEITIPWKEPDIAVLNTDTPTLFNSLHTRMSFTQQRVTHDTNEGRTLNKPPYKFLDYYTENDTDIFFGREAETSFVWQKILSHSNLILFGASGTGKTSLIQAGVIPKLKSQGYDALIVRPLNEPLPAISRAVEAKYASSTQLDSESRTLLQLLMSLIPVGSKLVIILDQFEETFLGSSIEMRQELYKAICDVIECRDLDVRFVIIIREDFLANLDEARNKIPSILSDSYRLTNFSKEQARTAILSPAKKAQIDIDMQLVEQLLEDLDEGSIAPPQLQIICFQLYQDLIHSSEPSAKLSLARYDNLGGASRILASYLDNVLDEIKNKRAKSRTIELLKVMVSSQRTKLALTLRELESNARVHGMSRKSITETLNVLLSKRLIRSFQRDNAVFFELSHDYISKRVGEWISEIEWVSKRAREMVAREITNWNEMQLLIPIERFQAINGLRNDILFLQEDEATLLAKTALEHDVDCRYWIERARQAGCTAWEIINETLANHTDPFVRSRAAGLIDSLPEKQAIAKLRTLTEDRHVQVREVIVDLLERFAAKEAVPELTKLLNDDYPSVRWRAARALHKIGNVEAFSTLQEYWPRDMLLIPGGDCLIGSTEEEVAKHVQATGNEGFRNELPQHKVYVSDFLVDRYLVTNLEYKKFIDATGYHPPSHWIDNQITVGTENHPVSSISYSDASAYAKWAGKRLLTEYEWEKAMSWNPNKNEKYIYPWGNKFGKNLCHVSVHLGREPFIDVGSYSPRGDSPYGVTDPIGNGWVWVDGTFAPYPNADFTDEDYYGKNLRIMRSCGGWDYEDSHSFHVTHRIGMPDTANSETTFRCGMSIPEYLLKLKTPSSK